MQEKNKNTLIFVVVAVVALSLGAWFGMDVIQMPQPVEKVEKIQGVMLTPAKTLPNFSLVDNKGHRFDLENLKNTWSLLFFGYTHCPDICPTSLQTLRNVVSQLDKMQVRPPQIIFISVDPERDTPEVLDRYVNYFDKDFIGLTGDIGELDKLAGSLGVYFRKAPGASGDINADDYVMNHTAAFIVINPQAKAAAFLSAPHRVDGIIHNLRMIVSKKLAVDRAYKIDSEAARFFTDD